MKGSNCLYIKKQIAVVCIIIYPVSHALQTNLLGANCLQGDHLREKCVHVNGGIYFRLCKLCLHVTCTSNNCSSRSCLILKNHNDPCLQNCGSFNQILMWVIMETSPLLFFLLWNVYIAEYFFRKENIPNSAQKMKIQQKIVFCYSDYIFEL